MGATPKGVSGSRIAGVLGLSPFNTPLAVWQQICEEREPGFNEKRGYALPVFEETAAQRWGLCFENAIAELAEKETGKRITDRERFFENGDMTAHVDGIFEDGVLYEAKTTTSFMFRDNWGEPGTDHIPRYYQAQIQWNMNLAGLREARAFVLTWPETPDAWERMGWKIEGGPGETLEDYWLKPTHKKNTGLVDPIFWANTFADIGNFHQYPVQAHPENQRVMVERYREFWHNHVLTGKPPEPRNYDDVKRLFTEPVGTIVCDAAMEAWWREYDAIRKEIGKGGAAAKRQEKLRLRILERARKLNPVMDDESQEKVIFRDVSGNKLGQYSKAGGFR